MGGVGLRVKNGACTIKSEEWRMKGDVFLVSVHLIWGMLWICYVMVMFTSVFPETYFVLGAYTQYFISKGFVKK